MQRGTNFIAARTRIEQLNKSEYGLWEQYVHQHPQATFAHLPGITEAFEKAYGLRTVVLAAFRSHDKGTNGSPGNPELRQSLVGLLPMVHIKHFLFANELISMPFLDSGGVIASDQEATKELVKEAIRIASSEGIKKVEFRQAVQEAHKATNEQEDRPKSETANVVEGYSKNILRHKVGMKLELPNSADALMQALKSKLRSQIRKPMREGLTVKSGGIERLDHFYEVFCVNMRDLGSPVHSKMFFQTIIRALPEKIRIFVVYHQNKPLAASIVVAFRDCLYNPWASSLRAYQKFNANMLLYWHMLEFGCQQHFKYFDFGRSTPEEGTFKFKTQWGAIPHPLEWIVFSIDGSYAADSQENKKNYSMAINCWKRLPVGLSRWLGPKIRKHISL